MPAAAQAAVRDRSASTGAILFLGLSLVLYQMTMLALGPGHDSRVLNISLSIPTVGLQQFPDPLLSDVHVVLGGRLAERVISLIEPIRLPSMARPVQPSTSTNASIATIAAGPSVTSPPNGTTAAAGSHKKSHYHDADERSLRLARRR